MSTRSNIAKTFEDGSVQMIYCHWDGYPSHNGRILKEHYSWDSIQEILDGGDISCLGENVETTDFYARDGGEDLSDTKARFYPSLYEAMQDMQEYLYVFTPTDPLLWCDSRGLIVPLTDEDIKND